MTRVKRGFVAKKRRKKILKLAKGFRGAHSKLFTAANQQTMKALRYAYFDRRKKKNEFRKIWIQRINVAARNNGIKYNKLINNLKISKVLLNKKILAKITISDNKTFNLITKI
uniref:Large ribosomal subunit protein bL20c n=1 Tax=Euglena anabaena TaxID=38273 RepID=A0A0G3F9K2_EUGAN|nr:ribosomal protein L20 [Euglenaria anabaena]AKJ83375.1 ribosomal protein L20 [Euglenaria anabaena]